ncbi:carbamoyltransferase C-terminal domain-containing protein [Nonomuraea sp. NPDC050786]|uniref:carbamoyltransferase family protein n=1 Tax=Nonomuraea sp. NPDC050786 TaxID=3154840 RepID=UPI00340B678A
MATYVGIAAGHVDPAVAVVHDGSVLAYVEEERLLRYKHAPHRYPVRALRWALRETGVEVSDIDAIAVAWDTDAFADGRIAAFYERLAADYRLDEATRRWQSQKLGSFTTAALQAHHARSWRRLFGEVSVPAVRGVPHHYVHAVQAGLQSGFDECVVLTADGSGDTECTVLWELRDGRLKPLRSITMPHSIGWFYAAITEYLGFHAYGEEYKVMGLAAYGEADAELAEKVARVLQPHPDGISYLLDPRFIHHGRHSHSGRFTDDMTELLGQPPRATGAEITGWHRAVARAAQQAVEDAMCRLVRWAVESTGLRHVAIGGGVANNVKMNAAIGDRSGAVATFAHPMCGDAGAAAGAALALSLEDGYPPEPLAHVALGPGLDEAQVEAELRRIGVAYERVDDPAAHTARELARGAIVGWVDGRMEAGARALGQRSILADPRDESMRDRVNEAVKMREPWRPFCPSIPAEVLGEYVTGNGDQRFMTVAGRATERLRRQAPAVVHVDGTVRAQAVDRSVLPAYHALLTGFGQLTGVPVLLNTSFNLAGEPIVCTVSDALRSFWSSALDMVVFGHFVVRKPLWVPETRSAG